MRVPAGKRDVAVFDDALPGFGVRKFASGKAYYFVKFTVGAKQRKLSLGPVVPGTLSEARKRASEILMRARAGQDVVAEKQVAKVKHKVALGELVPLYLDAKQDAFRPAHFLEATRYLRRYWSPLHGQAVEAIDRRQIVKVIDSLAYEHGKVASDRARTALSAFFAWAIDRGYLDLNPVQNIQRRASGASRSRVLSESELVAIWSACEDDDHGRIIRLLILTGQRRTEIGDLQRSEVDFAKRLIELPPERTKNNRSHLIPLSDASIELLAGVPERAGREYLFGDGARGFQGWSKAKARLDEKLPTLKAWTVHDIRRSVVTHLHELGFAPPHVVEAIVNHVSGHRGGVAGVYNKALYLPERHRAIAQWAAYLIVRSQKGAPLASREVTAVLCHA
jgi:integrase